MCGGALSRSGQWAILRRAWRKAGAEPGRLARLAAQQAQGGTGGASAGPDIDQRFGIALPQQPRCARPFPRLLQQRIRHGGQFRQPRAGKGAGRILIQPLLDHTVGRIHCLRLLVSLLGRIQASSFEHPLALTQKGLQSTVSSIDKQREALNLRIEKVQARLYAQYNAMDSLVGQLKRTSESLTNQLASLPGFVKKD